MLPHCSSEVTSAIDTEIKKESILVLIGTDCGDPKKVTLSLGGSELAHAIRVEAK
jgi:hypothetical protein